MSKANIKDQESNQILSALGLSDDLISRLQSAMISIEPEVTNLKLVINKDESGKSLRGFDIQFKDYKLVKTTD